MNHSSSQDGGLGFIGEEAVGGKGLLNKAANNKRRDLDDMGRRVKEKEREKGRKEKLVPTRSMEFYRLSN